MENLKALMGSAYHDGVTIEEVNSFLSGKKFVDLKEGNYVAKDKFDNLKNEHDTLVEKTKDYDSIKEANTKYETEKQESALNARLLSLGFNEKALKYVKGDLNDGTLKLSDDDKVAKKEAETYLKDHSTFASVKPDPKQPLANGKVVSTTVETDNGGSGSGAKSFNAIINNGIRAASGLKVNVDGDADNK